MPIDQGSMRSTGLMAIAYNRLKRHLGVEDSPTIMYDLVQQLAQPDDWFLERFHIDVIDLGRAFVNPKEWKPWTLPDGSEALVPPWFTPQMRDGDVEILGRDGRVIGRQPKGALYIDQTYWPLAGPDGLENYEPLEEKMEQAIWAALPAPPFDQPLTDERLEEIERVARYMYENTDYAISLSIGCNLFEWCQWLFGMENTYIYMGAEKRRLGRFLDRLVEYHTETLERLLPRVRGYVQILVVGDDLGMQTGPQMSPETYRELFLPRHKRLYHYAKELADAAIFMHCCGGIYELIPSLIEAGVDILNPVQTSAAGMDPATLKREFGRDLTFWGGGSDTQYLLPSGTPEQVRDDVRRRLEIFMPGGGYVWNQVHNVLADVPAENVVAMLDAAYEFGRY